MVEGQFKVWVPDDADESDEEMADLVEGESPQKAAVIWMQDHFVELNCPIEQEVHVRCHDGKLVKLILEAEETVLFSAREAS